MHHLQRSGAVSSDIGVWIGNIELRDDDADGDEIIVAAIFSYRRSSITTKRALEQDLATKARHLMRLDAR